MTPAAIALLDRLRAEGVTFVYVGAQLEAFGPRVVLTNPVCREIIAHEAEILEAVRQSGPWWCRECEREVGRAPEPAPRPGAIVICPDCYASRLTLARIVTTLRRRSGINGLWSMS